MINPFLISEKVYLSGLRAEDVDGPWLQWFNDQDNTWFMTNGMWPTSHEGHLEYFEHMRQSTSDLVLAICLKKDDSHIGNLGLHQIDPWNRKAELGIIIGETSVQTKGVATEAMRLLMAHGFNRLNLHKIWLRVDEQNKAARRAFEKASFQVEGVLREDLFHHRRWSASLYMGVLEEEFFERLPELLPLDPLVRKGSAAAAKRLPGSKKKRPGNSTGEETPA